jgi:hypothetical protein
LFGFTKNWIDIGIMRQLQGYWGPPTGELFETFVIAEIYKWVRTAGENVQLYFYRTRAGLEFDLMIQTPQGVLGLEIKSSRAIAAKDYRPLREVAAALKSDWRGGMVVTRGAQIEPLDAESKIWSVPVHRLLGF